ncbi:SDR family NAD(P)-dependent oxidoreductase [Conexibacter sp. SYSU D00693]|uniref:SDR family NAD(P)-dependent oxidoreductase n=1 Tax=Conexibacter sp. SYSU D00693 TaxID=2812560 RepID=UPI00196B6B75|nr:SDR family NAD(P)-dependent oxidoreductase [Conexibacter sp. SYSU D00693]
MSTDLRDKVAIVTGGASGLGRATALALAEAGAVVVVADVDETGGRAVAEEVGGHFVATDVADFDANHAMVDFAVERAGGVDLAYLNAGVSSGVGVVDGFDLERYRKVMGINLDGVVFGTHAVVPALRERGGGAIVATASLAGLTGLPMDPVYTANKHAVVGLARSLGPALEGEGIRFNAVCPGFAESQIIAGMREDLIEAGFPIIPAQDVAAAVLTLFTGDMSGECWFVQAGREPAPFGFRGIPGPRV